MLSGKRAIIAQVGASNPGDPRFINSSHGPHGAGSLVVSLFSGMFDLPIDPLPLDQAASVETTGLRLDYRVPSEFVNHTAERIIVIRSGPPSPSRTSRHPRHRKSTLSFLADDVGTTRKKIVPDRPDLPGEGSRGKYSPRKLQPASSPAMHNCRARNVSDIS